MSSEANHRNIIFAGSSSGGHLLPGLAVAEEILAIHPDIRIHFVTAGREIEDQFFQPYPEIQRHRLEVPPVKRLLRNPLRTALGLKRASSESRWVIRELQPAVVVGLGGVQAVPLVRAAQKNRTPVVLMEQNIIPGKATQFAAHYATRICVSFEDTRQYFSRSDRCIVTGNPLRRSLVERFHCEDSAVLQPESDEKTLFILGGSQGATAVNEAVMTMVEDNLEQFKTWNVVHQTGHAQFEEVHNHYSRIGIAANVAAYFDNMAELYQQATIVICRAGATTLAELALAGKPSIVLPYPQSSREHQLLNAKWYAARNATRYVEQTSTEKTAAAMWNELQPLINDKNARHDLAENIRRDAIPEAACHVRDEIMKLI